jgi:hypothetical protein
VGGGDFGNGWEIVSGMNVMYIGWEGGEGVDTNRLHKVENKDCQYERISVGSLGT